MGENKNKILNSFLVWSIFLFTGIGTAIWMMKPVEQNFALAKADKSFQIEDLKKERSKKNGSNAWDLEENWGQNKNSKETLNSDLKSDLNSAKKPDDGLLNTQVSASIKMKVDEAITYVDEGNWKKAEDILREVLEDDPNNETALMEMANINLLDKRDLNSALPYIRKTLEVNSGNEDMLNELINVYEELGTLEDGLDFLTSLPPNSKGAADGTLDRGIATTLMTLNRNEEAVDYLKNAINKGAEINGGELFGELGDAYNSSGNTDKAIDTYLQAIDLAEKQRQKNYDQDSISDLKIRLGQSYLKSGDKDKVLELAKELEEEDPYSEKVIAFREQVKSKF